MRKRYPAGILLALFTWVTLSAAAMAGSGFVNIAATALNRSSIYVDPAVSSTLSTQDIQVVTQKIASGNTPIYLAVLPEAALSETNGNTGTLPQNIGNVLNKRGTVGVLLPNKGFYASSNVLPSGQASDLAKQVDTANGNNYGGLLTDFVGRVQKVAVSAPAAAPSGSSNSGRTVVVKEKSHGLPGVIIFIIVVGVLLFVGLFIALLYRRSQRKDQEKAEGREFNRLHAEVSSSHDELASQVLSNGSLGNSHNDEALRWYNKAAERERTAGADLGTATTVGELTAIAKAVQDGLKYMSYAEKAEQGEEVTDTTSPANSGPTSWPNSSSSNTASAAPRATGAYSWNKATGAKTGVTNLNDRPKVQGVPAPEGRTTKTIITTTGSIDGYWYGGGLDPNDLYWGPGYWPGRYPWANPVLLWDPYLYDPYMYNSWATDRAYARGLSDARYAEDYAEAHEQHNRNYDDDSAGQYDNAQPGSYDNGSRDGSYDQGGGGNFRSDPEPADTGRHSAPDPEPAQTYEPPPTYEPSYSPPDTGGGWGDSGGGFDSGGGGDF